MFLRAARSWWRYRKFLLDKRNASIEGRRSPNLFRGNYAAGKRIGPLNIMAKKEVKMDSAPEQSPEQAFEQSVQEAYQPKFTLDLRTASPEHFAELVIEFDKWRESLGELPKLDLTNGWYSAAQELAEQWLLRNIKNRKASLATVIYYAVQQAAGKWPRTGQAIIFNTKGELLDGQQRLWACYLGNTTFDTYVVADVPAETPNLFAYMDNGKARTPAVALQTAGLNGLSPLIAQTVTVLQSFELHAYTATHKKRMPRMAPIDVITYVESHPLIRRAAKLAAGEYAQACEVIGYRDVVAFCVYKVVELFDESVSDEFFEDVGAANEEFPEGSPIAALHKVLEANEKCKEPMNKHQVLAHVIKAFNAWKGGVSIKKLTFRVNEAFPEFIVDSEQSQEEAA